MIEGQAGGWTNNLAACMERRAQSQAWLHRPAYVVGQQVMSHGDVHDSAARTASLLAELGVGTGDRVLIALPDGTELVSAFLGAIRLGAIAILVNPRLHADDHRRMNEVGDPRLVVCPAELADRFGAHPVILGEGLAGESALFAPHPITEVGPDMPAYAQFSSGTTGRPKAALHRHGDAVVFHQAFAVRAIELQPSDVVLSVSKMHFAYGLGNSLFFPLLSGCRCVLHGGAPKAGVVADLVERHRVSVLFAVPTFYAHLVASTRPEQLASVRVAVSAGEALTSVLASRARAFLGCPVLDGLGSTEVGQTFVSNTLMASRDGTVGRPLPPFQVAVRDARGRRVSSGHAGTLWVRGPTVLLRYLGEAEPATAIWDGEWLCTGDRAVIDADEFVSLRGRVDDVELVGGVSVAPQEIEDLLSNCPGVIEAAVAAVRDEAGASRLEAFVVPASGPDGSLAAGLIDQARRRLAPHKVPRAVHLVSELPRTPTGKLRRFVLRSGTWPASAAAQAQD